MLGVYKRLSSEGIAIQYVIMWFIPIFSAVVDVVTGPVNAPRESRAFAATIATKWAILQWIVLHKRLNEDASKLITL